MRAASSAARLLMLAVGVMVTVGIAAQQQRQVFVSVTDARGVPLLNLAPEAFKVFEDRIPAKILKVDPIDWPIKLTVLVDNGSASGGYIANLRSGVKALFNEIPDDVEMSLLTLAPQPRWVVKPTTNLDALMKGVDLITPDSAVGKFFDGLSEAAARVDKEKGRYFPVFVEVTSDVGNIDAPLPRDYERLNQRTKADAITVHFVMLVSAATATTVGGVTGNVQTQVGLALTSLSGGRYESINADSRLPALLAEIGQQIARSHLKQTHQYRVTYEPPPNPRVAKDVSVSVTADSVVTVEPSADGHLP